MHTFLNQSDSDKGTVVLIEFKIGKTSYYHQLQNLPVIDWTKMAQYQAKTCSDYRLLEHAFGDILVNYIFVLVLIYQPSSNYGIHWSL